MDNYEYCIQYAMKFPSEAPPAVLDFGCGNGKIVKGLLDKNIMASGCDVFYEAADYSKILPEGLFNIAIFKMENGRIPFPEDCFDLVINNQVLEHVEDLEFVLSEINRVLKPGGRVLSLFPSIETWREGHCGIPFLHWFPKGSVIKVYYAMVMRIVGLGNYKKKKSYYQWSKEFCDWIDQWTFYRPYHEIEVSFGKNFGPMKHIEDDWLDKRLESRFPFGKRLPAYIKKQITRKFGGLVFVCQKRCT